MVSIAKKLVLVVLINLILINIKMISAKIKTNLMILIRMKIFLILTTRMNIKILMKVMMILMGIKFILVMIALKKVILMNMTMLNVKMIQKMQRRIVRADEYRFYRLAARADLRLSEARTTLHDNDHHRDRHHHYHDDDDHHLHDNHQPQDQSLSSS